MQKLLAKYNESKKRSSEEGKDNTIEPDSKRSRPISSSSSSTPVNSSTTTAVAPSPLSNKEVALVFQGCEGFANSITHYYHFLFGMLFPMIEYHLKNRQKALGYRIATDIGPMKRLLCELPLNLTSLVGPENSKTRNGAKNDRNYVVLPAYDCFLEQIYTDPYTTKISKQTITAILTFFDQTIPDYIRQTKTYDVLLIERTNQESYYRDMETEDRHRRSGANLRSISNHQELSNRLTEVFQSREETFGSVTLERASIYYQYHLFKHAKIVIAQHGAALSNIVFMQKKSEYTVIEINPTAQVLAQFQDSARSHFRNLAKHVGLDLITVQQKHDHSAIDCEEVIQAVEQAYMKLSSAKNKTEVLLDH